jgi:hypothetical protein
VATDEHNTKLTTIISTLYFSKKKKKNIQASLTNYEIREQEHKGDRMLHRVFILEKKKKDIYRQKYFPALNSTKNFSWTF